MRDGICERGGAYHPPVSSDGSRQRALRPAFCDEGEQIIPDDLFAKMRLEPAGKPLTVFRAELTGCEEAGWEDLFAGFTTLKAITFSSSIELLLRLSERLDNMEVVFVSV